MTIETGKEFCYEKLISLRTYGTSAEIIKAINQLIDYLTAKKIKKTGPTITATFSTEQSGEEMIFDMEILIPVDRLFAPEHGYIFKSKFQLTDAAHTCYKGHSDKLSDTCNEFIRYIKEHKHHNITALYNVLNDDSALCGEAAGEISVDLYIGFNASAI